MIYLLIFVVLLVAYFVYHAKSMGYQLRSVQKHSQEVQKAIDTMATVAAPTGQKVQGIPHIQDAQRNMNRILSKYPNDKVICQSALNDFKQYLDASLLQTSNRINTFQQITTADDAINAIKDSESDDSGYILEQVRRRQRELLGEEYIEAEIS